MFGAKFVSKAVTHIPSVAEGVLDFAERGGYRGEPEPLQRLSTRKVYVVTRRLDAQLDPTRSATVELVEVIGTSIAGLWKCLDA
jgi:hypothetical protein